MNMTKEFINLAKRDLGASKMVMSGGGLDDAYINVSAYLCQQALEKVIKSLYFENRIALLKSYKIGDLLSHLEEGGIDIGMFDTIRDQSDTITGWAENTRYVIEPLTSKKHIDEVRNIIKGIIDEVERKYTTYSKESISQDFKSDRLKKIGK